MSRILLTGAAGGLGQVLRKRLRNWPGVKLRVSDIADLGAAEEGEEVVQCDLADLGAMLTLVDGVDQIIHLGGVSVEDTFDNILNANLRGVYNLYEAARQKGVSRIVFASSNHVIGFHTRETQLDASSPMRPDSLYGVSKGYGELLARYYFDKFKIESACIRIGSSFPKPRNRRMLATWLSYDDLTALMKRVLEVDRLGFAIVYGVSANKECWWDNHLSAYIGWEPEDSSEIFRSDEALVNEVVDPFDPAIEFQGGTFAASGHFEDPQ
ncbi:NAD(P)-dependent oxidoreductase [Aestuariirhabdus sp. Z084]|uniref:NAD-dependent epimerase/dehydratase family protein n=1 Tax=Aestuariirhabdus haliotis TaxID=2918751 RepID=UPI00201B3B40|nr:NAD(P)-dependent oxidoreductase [Aestuariirhabdus haliotis]MCL6415102.1 NAD(P)-dependent oxidoreductase [Aestuariirhabdus haliotis]MCL6419034.1 NAD(P)-dependent oxidoreductase [Aestuariirhabdus haliotis]